jgi:hypothetical protein
VYRAVVGGGRPSSESESEKWEKSSTAGGSCRTVSSEESAMSVGEWMAQVAKHEMMDLAKDKERESRG